jgi:2-oxoglutarate ferredoxin oxidoreductase subunit alpha
MVMYGRNSESPVPVVAARSPSDCFHAAIEAARIALKYRTPVYLLSDAYLANGSEPWLLPDLGTLPDLTPTFATEPNAGEEFLPYLRDEQTLARPWALPGTPGLEHRIGGLSKQENTGNVSYDPHNNARMIALREEKVARIAAELPPVEITGDDRGDLLVVGWGGTHGAIASAVESARADGLAVSAIHLRHLNPFPPNLGEVLASFDQVLLPELNAGQLAMLLRARFLIDVQSLSKIQGQPFKVQEIRARIDELLRAEA